MNPRTTPTASLELSTELPTEVTANFHYLQALWLRRNGQLLEANWHLTQAKTAYIAINQTQGVVRTTLELARLAHPQVGWPPAHRFLHNEVQPLFDQNRVDDPSLQAHCYLQMADVAREQGDWLTGVHYARQALALYTQVAHAYGQLLAQLWLLTYALSRGDHAAAHNYLQQAHQLATTNPLGTPASIRLHQGELLLAWHQRAATVLPLAQAYLTIADTEPYSPERIDARLLLGNAYRDCGEYDTAQSYYDEAGALIEALGYSSFLVRLQVEIAWLSLLEGRLNHAHAVVTEQSPQTLPAQQMALQVILAVLQMLDGEWQAAETLLHEVCAFYEKADDPLTVCTLRLYLAYSALHQTETAPVLRYLEQALGWLNAQGLNTFPQWWHPKILAAVCTHALLSNLYPDLVAQMLVQHLGKVSLPFLKLLDTTDDIELRRQALRLQQMINGAADPLVHLADSPSKRAIATLLAEGDLRAEAYRELESELMTATNRLTPNPTIIAVFGLYLKGLSRAAIATELACSTENVRNYITIIYNHFALPAYRFHRREARRQKLIEVAQARGFIY